MSCVANTIRAQRGKGFSCPLPGGSSSLAEHQSFQTFIFKDVARDDS